MTTSRQPAPAFGQFIQGAAPAAGGVAFDPFGSFVQGINLGIGLENLEVVRQQRAQAEVERARMEAEIQKAERQRLRVQAASEKLFSMNPQDRLNAQELGLLALNIPKEQFAQLQSVLTSQSEEQQRRSFAFPTQVYAAYLQNDPATVKRLFEIQMQATQDPQAQQALRAAKEIYEINPNAGIAMLTAPMTISKLGQELLTVAETRAKAPINVRTAQVALDKAEADARAAGVAAEFARPVALANLSKAAADALTSQSNARFADQLNQANITKMEWDTRNLQNQIRERSAKLRLDEVNIQSQIQERLANIQDKLFGVPEGARKPINDAFVQGAAAKQQEGQFNSLASRITNIGTAWGRLGSFDEWIKKSTGSENAVSELRQEYIRLRSTAAIQSLPPGPATDRDIQLALSGFPAETGNPQIIASFLRGVAKMKGIEAAVENSKAEWLTNNRGLLGRATTGFIAGDYSVRPGETFADLSKRIAEEMNQRYLSPEQRQAQVTQQRIQQIPGGVPGQQPAMPQRQIGPAPAATPGVVDIMRQADAIISGQR